MKQQALKDIFTKGETQIYALCTELKYTEYIYISNYLHFMQTLNI